MRDFSLKSNLVIIRLIQNHVVLLVSSFDIYMLLGSIIQCPISSWSSTNENSLCLATTIGAPIMVIIHVMDHLTHMLSTIVLSWHKIVMNILNIDAWQRQKLLTSAESCYFMLLSDKFSYLLDRVMLLSQIIATMISIVKCERNNLPFTFEDNCRVIRTGASDLKLFVGGVYLPIHTLNLMPV